MKKSSCAVFCLLFFVASGSFLQAQDSTKRFELGSTLFTLNSLSRMNYFAPEKPPVEFMNGLFFRYTKNKFAFRLHTSYSDNYATFGPPPSWYDSWSGDVHNKDFRIGGGIQYSFLKRKSFLYTFADLSYRNVFSTGNYYGGIAGLNDRYTKTTNGFETFLGLGARFKLFGPINLSLETGYMISYGKVRHKMTSSSTGVTKTNVSNMLNALPSAKINLTVRF